MQRRQEISWTFARTADPQRRDIRQGIEGEGTTSTIGPSHGPRSVKATSGKEKTLSELRREIGVSDAGVKWYLRYIKEGLTPEGAKEKVLDRPKTLVQNS